MQLFDMPYLSVSATIISITSFRHKNYRQTFHYCESLMLQSGNGTTSRICSPTTSNTTLMNESGSNHSLTDSGHETFKLHTKSFNPSNAGQFESNSNASLTDSCPEMFKFTTKSFNPSNETSTSNAQDDKAEANLKENYLKQQPNTRKVSVQYIWCSKLFITFKCHGGGDL